MMNTTSVDPKRINVFIVGGIIKTGPDGSTGPAFNAPAVGIQSYFQIGSPCGTAQIKEAILLTPYAAARCGTPASCAGGPPVPRASDKVLAHELVHRLINQHGGFLSAAGYYTSEVDVATGKTLGHRLQDGSGNCLPANHLMCPYDNLAGELLLTGGLTDDAKDDNLSNVTNHFSTDLILPDKGVAP